MKKMEIIIMTQMLLSNQSPPGLDVEHKDIFPNLQPSWSKTAEKLVPKKDGHYQGNSTQLL